MALRVSSDSSHSASTASLYPSPQSDLSDEAPAAASTAAKTHKLGKRMRNPTNREPLSTASSRIRHSKRQTPSSDDVNKEADDLFDHHKNEKALLAYETTLSKNPHNQEAFFKKAVCQWNLEQIEESINSFTQYLKKYPKDAKAWARKGAILLYQNEYPQALAALRKSVTLDQSEFFLRFYLLGPCYESFRIDVISTFQHLWDQKEPAVTAQNLHITIQDLHLLRGIFLAARREFPNALDELNVASQNSGDNFALLLHHIVKQGSQLPTKPKRKSEKYRPNRREPAVLLNTDEIDPNPVKMPAPFVLYV